MRQRLNLATVLTVMAVIGYYSLIPYSGSGGGFTTPLLKHLAAYFVLAAALMVYFHDTRKGHTEAVLVAGLFGLSMEIVQNFLPIRSFGFKDILVNFAGASIVMLDHRSKIVTTIVRLEDEMIEQVLEKSF